MVVPPGLGVQHWVRASLRTSRTPTVIGFADHLPYTETGKLLRRVLKAELLNLPAT